MGVSCISANMGLVQYFATAPGLLITAAQNIRRHGSRKPTVVRRAVTHTVTHTGKRADGINGKKSVKDLVLLSGNGPKALEMKGLDVLDHLVRMRSAVRICPAAPKALKTSVFKAFCFVWKKQQTVSLVCRKGRRGTVCFDCHSSINTLIKPHLPQEECTMNVGDGLNTYLEPGSEQSFIYAFLAMILFAWIYTA